MFVYSPARMSTKNNESMVENQLFFRSQFFETIFHHSS